MRSGRQLAIPRSGSAQVNLDANNRPILGQLITFAAWENPEREENAQGGIPKRMVVRLDGHITSTDDGFPIFVSKVRYSIGGYVREVLVDSVNQSALVVWAESIDVTAHFDKHRFDRMISQKDPSNAQILAASISGCECGDVGPADARYLDMIAVDFHGEEDPTEWSLHRIPHGARGLRFLDAIVAGNMFSVPGATDAILWSADNFDVFPGGFVQANTNGATDTSILIVPPVAKWLFLRFPAGTIASFQAPSWIEWIIAPNTLPGF